MKTINHDMVFFFDVDDTLVRESKKTAKDSVREITIVDKTDGSKNVRVTHQKHVDLLKKYKARGHGIVVWSGNGYKWAESVIAALGLTEHVDLALTKPARYVDDLKCEAWMGGHIYLPEE